MSTRRNLLTLWENVWKEEPSILHNDQIRYDRVGRKFVYAWLPIKIGNKDKDW